jgi:hypothetical protein
MEDKIFEECLDYYMNSKGAYWKPLAEKHGFPNAEAIRCKFKDERIKRGIPSKTGFETSSKREILDEDGEIKYSEKEEIKSDGSVYSDKLIRMSKEEKRSPVRLLELHGFDPDLWEVVSCTNNLWHAMRKNDLGRLLQYQSKLTAKPKSGNKITFSDIDKFFNNYTYKTGIFPKKHKKNNGKVLEIDIADMHNGKVPFLGDDTVQENFYYTMSEILQKIEGKNISKIYFNPMGDTSYFDHVNGSTTSGTIVSQNKSLQTVFDETTDMFIDAITKLSEIADVEVLHIPGNHDVGFSYYLVKSLEMYFRKNDNVSIDTDHRPRKFRKIGKTLIGWNHGNISKANSIQWLQVEAREEWGQTESSEIHSAHIHSQMTIEKGGTILRHLPSMTPTDQWHYEKGYVGAVRSTCCFLYDLEKGLEEQWFINIPN